MIQKIREDPKFYTKIFIIIIAITLINFFIIGWVHSLSQFLIALIFILIPRNKITPETKSTLGGLAILIMGAITSKSFLIQVEMAVLVLGPITFLFMAALFTTLFAEAKHSNKILIMSLIPLGISLILLKISGYWLW